MNPHQDAAQVPRQNALPRAIQTHEYLRAKNKADVPYHFDGYLLNEPYFGTYFNERGIRIPERGSIEIIAMSVHNGTWLQCETPGRIDGYQVKLTSDGAEGSELYTHTALIHNASEAVMDLIHQELTEILRREGFDSARSVLERAA